MRTSDKGDRAKILSWASQLLSAFHYEVFDAGSPTHRLAQERQTMGVDHTMSTSFQGTKESYYGGTGVGIFRLC